MAAPATGSSPGRCERTGRPPPRGTSPGRSGRRGSCPADCRTPGPADQQQGVPGRVAPLWPPGATQPGRSGRVRGPLGRLAERMASSATTSPATGTATSSRRSATGSTAGRAGGVRCRPVWPPPDHQSRPRAPPPWAPHGGEPGIASDVAPSRASESSRRRRATRSRRGRGGWSSLPRGRRSPGAGKHREQRRAEQRADRGEAPGGPDDGPTACAVAARLSSCIAHAAKPPPRAIEGRLGSQQPGSPRGDQRSPLRGHAPSLEPVGGGSRRRSRHVRGG